MNSSTNPVDIRPDHLAIVRDILRAHLPAGFEVWVFGSRANWTTKDSSDLDLAVEGAARLDYRIMGDLEIAFEESDLLYAVDVVDLKDVSPEFKNIVDSQKVPLLATADHPNPAEEWEERPFEEVIDFREGPGILAKDFREDGVPLVRLAGLSRGASVLAGCNYLDPESSAKRWDQFRLEFGDVLLSTSASLGRIAVVGEEGIGAVPYTGIIRMRPRDTTVHRPFIRYLLEGPDFQQQCEVVGVGSVIRHFGPMHLRQMTLKIPPLPEQRAIAHILGTLDDKIELNRRMNQTLESMARAIFQDWFVAFGPVRAKLEGREPYLPPELWDLFPDDLVDSELGEIPEGWDVKTLSGCIDVERGLSYKGSGLGSTGIPMHNLNSLYEGGGYKHDGIKYYNGDYRERHVTEPGDVLVANTEQGHDRLLIGFAAIVPDCSGHRGLFSHHLYRMRPKIHSGLSEDFLCKLLNTEAMHDTVSGFATGTTVNMLPADALQIPGIIYPPVSVVTAYTAIAKTARRRQEHLYEESRTLAEQRDAFLPNLMSGELLLGN